MVSVPPWLVWDGDSPPITGGDCDAVGTTKFARDVAVPAGVLTGTVPVVAPGGTTTVISVAVTEVGVTVCPLNETVVSEVDPKPVPEIFTTVPGAPRLGETCATIVSIS